MADEFDRFCLCNLFLICVNFFFVEGEEFFPWKIQKTVVKSKKKFKFKIERNFHFNQFVIVHKTKLYSCTCCHHKVVKQNSCLKLLVTSIGSCSDFQVRINTLDGFFCQNVNWQLRAKFKMLRVLNNLFTHFKINFRTFSTFFHYTFLNEKLLKIKL